MANLERKKKLRKKPLMAVATIAATMLASVWTLRALQVRLVADRPGPKIANFADSEEGHQGGLLALEAANNRTGRKAPERYEGRQFSGPIPVEEGVVGQSVPARLVEPLQFPPQNTARPMFTTTPPLTAPVPKSHEASSAAAEDTSPMADDTAPTLMPVGQADQVADIPRESIRALPLVRLGSLLHSEGTTRVAAEAEVVRRGCTPKQIELLRQISDPDPQVRRAAAETLPRQPGVDGRPWLLWLAHDTNAEVRWTAISLLATSGDPETLRQIQELARQDSDPRIQALAEIVRP